MEGAGVGGAAAAGCGTSRVPDVFLQAQSKPWVARVTPQTRWGHFFQLKALRFPRSSSLPTFLLDRGDQPQRRCTRPRQRPHQSGFGTYPNATGDQGRQLPGSHSPFSRPKSPGWAPGQATFSLTYTRTHTGAAVLCTGHTSIHSPPRASSPKPTP